MKTYITEQAFVTNFSADVKTESNFEVNGKQFAATYVGKNSGQQAVYKVTLDGTTREMNITQLKKRLGVTYTRECSRTGETKTTTRFIEKTDDELMETAKRVAEKAAKAHDIICAIASEYKTLAEIVLNDGYLDANDGEEKWKTLVEIVFDELKDRQNTILQEKAEKAEKAAKEKAELEAELEAAMQAKNYKAIADISVKLAKL